ncbi:MAG: FAD-dependent oxidoreductase [Minisyncoccia bacterium]
MENKLYDLIIIGSGPAGLTASIYASRYKMSNMVIGSLPGGTITEAWVVENFPAFNKIPGMELGQKMYEHAKELGAETILDDAKDISSESGVFKIKVSQDKEYLAKNILIATGSQARRLNLPNEDKYIGKGVVYCATCDAYFFKGKTVAVIGAANSAITAALLLSTLADKVYMIYRSENLKGDPVWIDKVKENPKIILIPNTNIIGLSGENNLEKVTLDNPYNNSTELAVDGLFIEIGVVPNTVLTNKIGVSTDEKGYIVVDNAQSTNISGIWAAGDITNNSNNLHQVITACAEGAVAANAIFMSKERKA